MKWFQTTNFFFFFLCFVFRFFRLESSDELDESEESEDELLESDEELLDDELSLELESSESSLLSPGLKKC